jgi:hypothetical protein
MQIFDLHLVLLQNPYIYKKNKTMKFFLFSPQHTAVVFIEILRLYDGDKNTGTKLSISIKCIEIIA